MICRAVAYGSADYNQALALRHSILRAPLGLEFTDAELALDADAVHIVAMRLEQLVGCVQAHIISADTAKIRQMAVEESAQGQGVGRALMQALETELAAQHITTITLHARHTAMLFYAALGYKAEGTEFTEIGITHQLMRKSLGDL